MRGFPKVNVCFSCVRPKHQIHFLQRTEPASQMFVKEHINDMKYLQGTYVISRHYPLHLFALCYYLFLDSSLRCATFSGGVWLSAVGVKLTPADTFRCLSATEFGCDIIPGNVNLIWDKALHGWLRLLFQQISVSLQNVTVLSDRILYIV